MEFDEEKEGMILYRARVRLFCGGGLEQKEAQDKLVPDGMLLGCRASSVLPWLCPCKARILGPCVASNRGGIGIDGKPVRARQSSG